jgi:DNA polymerase V
MPFGKSLKSSKSVDTIRGHSTPAAYHRRDLFDARDQARQARLMRALDRLNADYGARTVHFGSFGGSRPAWAMRQQFCSPRYTTNWKELPVVR